jgi:hypothetical protein
MMRRLFLDDSEPRIARFLREFPGSTIVRSAEEAKSLLALQDWDEVWLDHDLGGERFVDPARPDSGSEVVRWILKVSPPVKRFIVHTCNEAAARSVEIWHT